MTTEKLEMEIQAKRERVEKAQAKREKAKERRALRKTNNELAINEIVALLTEEQVAKLSNCAKHLIAQMRGELAREQNVYVPKEGDKLSKVFMMYPNISYKKLMKKLESHNLKLVGDTITK